MNDKLDRFSNSWMNKSFPDPQQKEPVIFDECAGCNEPIHINDEYYEIYGMCVHDEKKCIIEAVDGRFKIAEGDIR